VQNILIRVVDKYRNDFSKEFDIEVLQNQSGATGIEFDRTESPGVYPNPANRYINIPSSSGPTSVSFFDLTGKEVLKEGSEGRVDVSDLPMGMYIVLLKNEEGTYTEKIMIQR
jgi:hypothetical protein